MSNRPADGPVKLGRNIPERCPRSKRAVRRRPRAVRCRPRAVRHRPRAVRCRHTAVRRRHTAVRCRHTAVRCRHTDVRRRHTDVRRRHGCSMSTHSRQPRDPALESNPWSRVSSGIASPGLSSSGWGVMNKFHPDRAPSAARAQAGARRRRAAPPPPPEPKPDLRPQPARPAVARVEVVVKGMDGKVLKLRIGDDKVHRIAKPASDQGRRQHHILRRSRSWDRLLVFEEGRAQRRPRLQAPS